MDDDPRRVSWNPQPIARSFASLRFPNRDRHHQHQENFPSNFFLNRGFGQYRPRVHPISDSLLRNLYPVSVSLNEIDQRMDDKRKKYSVGSVNEIRALEHQTLKVPYEILNKKFRVAQKNIDREAFQVQKVFSNLEKALGPDAPQGSLSAGKVNLILDDVVAKLKTLKRKSFESINEEIQAATVCKKRLDHLKLYTSNIDDDSHQAESDLERWRNIRMDRFLVDHCLRQGFYETAMQLSTEAGINDLTNIEIFLICRDIENSLSSKDTSKCLAWCHDNKSKLRKINSNLEFRLRKQDFVELIKANKRFAAVQYAQKYLSLFEDLPSIQKELENVMGLLAYSSKYHNDRYKDLLDENQWQCLVTQFRDENFKIYQLNSSSVFAMTLQAGLSSLKTLQCYRKDVAKNSECPVCSQILNQLASDLPCAHCSQSRLVCNISGQPMNENNPPLALPNGYVYSELALKQMALENCGKITCPRTDQVYDYEKLQKVFVM